MRSTLSIALTTRRDSGWPYPKTLAAERLGLGAQSHPLPRVCDSDLLRARAQSCLREVAPAWELANVWDALVTGSKRVTSAFHARDRALLVLSNANERVRGEAVDLEMLERGLRGDSLKVLAIEHRMSCSTVSVRLGNQLTAMGLHRQLTQVPLPLFVAANSRRLSRDVPVEKGILETRDAALEVVALRVPLTSWASALSPTEVEVALLLVQGKSYEEVAAARRRSVRTVANQVATLFRKLALGSRKALAYRVACAALEYETSIPDALATHLHQ